MKALVVENDSSLLRAVVRLVQSLGWEVVTAPSYEEAVSVLANPAHLDVLLTDFDLGSSEGNGGDLVRLAVEQRPGLRPIVMSAEDREPSEIAPAVFLRKPFGRATLQAKVCEQQ